MNDALVVRGGEGVGDLRGQSQRIVGRDRPALDPIGQGLTLEQLQHEVVDVVVVADVVQRADVRVIEVRDHPGLALEALPGLRLIGKMPRQYLDRDHAVETCVARAVDLAHSPLADLLDQAVVGQHLAGLYRHGVLPKPWVGWSLCGLAARRQEDRSWEGTAG